MKSLLLLLAIITQIHAQPLGPTIYPRIRYRTLQVWWKDVRDPVTGREYLTEAQWSFDCGQTWEPALNKTAVTINGVQWAYSSISLDHSNVLCRVAVYPLAAR